MTDETVTGIAKDQAPKRKPGRPPKQETVEAKPQLERIRLLFGYVPFYIPEDRMLSKEEWAEGVRPKAAATSVIEEHREQARKLVSERRAELVFDDIELDWVTDKEKRQREAAAEKAALEQRAAEIFAHRLASRDLRK